MNLKFLFPIPLLTSPLKGEELHEVCDDYPPLQGEGWGGGGDDREIKKFFIS